MAEKEDVKKPSWIKLSKADLEKIVVDLARKGKTPAQIGLILRDEHGVPRTKLFGKKISQILKDNKIEYITEGDSMKNKIEGLKGHIDKNKHDYPASRSLTKKLWALKRVESQ